MSNHKPQPLAIVGMACRFPKGLESIEALWNALKLGASAIGPVPKDRWTVDRYYSSNPIAKGKSYIRRGGFLTHDIRRFDAAFFGISPRDAEVMDPQQRLLLEVVWEAFENSGMLLPHYSGGKVGVYVGGFMLDHMLTQMSAGNRSAINQHTAAGIMMTMLSNRISHTFDFRGPSLSIDTACSSSLVAFHVACQDLWRGDSELAIVGGANVMLRPEYPIGMCKGGFLAGDGECKSFDERGDGYGRGEGAGAVLVQPLENALRDGNEILATVLATGSNQDGRTPGISMPSGEAQQALIEDVCQRSGIDPASIEYVECHGTGTGIGDPTETRAIAAVYGQARHNKQLGPITVGSIKSNIGHLEAAAGIAGVIKATLTVMHRESTPLANLQTPNPAILCDEWNLKLADAVQTLGVGQDKIRVAINSFGYGGSNAHVILQSAPNVHSPTQRPATESPGCMPYLLPISGRSDGAVRALASQYAKLLQNRDVVLEDVLYSAAFKRAHLTCRAVIKGKDRDALRAGLEALADNVEHENVVCGNQPFQGRRQPVFVFTGMGPQWWAMGQELYREEPVYQAAVRQADTIFKSISGFSALDEMLKDEHNSRITQTEFAQPANLIVQLGLLAMLRAAGVQPGAVVGHSVGELASAFAAGVLNLHEVLAVCYHRSRLQATCKGTGAMLAVGLSKENALGCIAEHAESVSVAAINGPTHVTMAGDVDALAEIAMQLSQQGVFHKFLDVEVPYHSPMMEPIMAELRQALAGITPRLPTLPLYSTVSGGLVEDIAYGADYWPANIRQSVEFATAVDALLDDGYNTFLEVGPHPVLASSIRDCIKLHGTDSRQAYTLRRNMPELQTVHQSVMQMFADGCDIDWHVHCPTGNFIPLPNYPWQREHYWVENERAMQDRIGPIDFPMLGIQEAPGAMAYRNDFDHEPMLYLRDHVVAGLPVLPAAGYVEALLELAGIEHPEAKGFAVRDLEIKSPMIITAERGLDCVTTYEPSGRSATIRSLENGRLGSGQVHVTAKLAGLEKFSPVRRDLEKLKSANSVRHDIQEFYSELDSIGLSYGTAFQSIRELSSSQSADQVLSRIEMLPELTHNLELYCLHPTLLDACFQSLTVMLADSDTTFLPTGISELCVYARNLPAAVWCHAQRIEQNERQVVCDLTLFDAGGNALAALRSMQLTAASRRERRDRFGDRIKRQILDYQWSYGPALTEPKRLGHWLVIGDPCQLDDNLLDKMQEYGASISSVVRFGESYQRLEQDFVVRKGSREDAQRVLREVGDLDGVVFLHSLSASVESDPIAEDGLLALTAWTQAMLELCAQRPPRVYVLTQGGCVVNGQDAHVQPGHWAFNGFCRVAFCELEGFQFSSIDLPAQIDSTITDNLVLELLCDDEHDEVALRGGFRLYSELLDSHVLSDDRVKSCELDDEHPILVRPLREDCESVGTARLVATRHPPLGPSDIQLRIETTVVPPDLLLEPVVGVVVQPLVEIVGRIVAVGELVHDVAVSTRVCGFAPTDLASHMVGSRSDFKIVAIDEQADAAHVTSVMRGNVRAAAGARSLRLRQGQMALVVADALGCSTAMILASQGVQVALLSDGLEALDPLLADKFPVYSLCPEGIAAAVARETHGRKFDLLAAPLKQWQNQFGFQMIRTGGSLLDLDAVAGPVAVPESVTAVARTDYRVLLGHGDVLTRALEDVLQLIKTDTIPTPSWLDVSITDLGWQKLPQADTAAQLVLHYGTEQTAVHDAQPSGGYSVDGQSEAAHFVGGHAEGNGAVGVLAASKQLPVVQLDDLKFDPHATYLITGGFGGLGVKTAQWLIQHHAKYVVLTGRTGADSQERQQAVQALQAQGAHVTAVACDTSDLEALTSLFETIAKTLPPLKGIFHSGAQILDQPIAEIDQETMLKVLRSKALGAWNLHLLTQDLPLTHFVLYASVANLVGNARQAAYCAANGFLNGLAHYRKMRCLPATSVNWGAIGDVGVVANDEKLEQFLRYTGLRSISSSEGLELLRIGLSRQATLFGVTLITSWADWARFETLGSTSPRFRSLIEADSHGKDASTHIALIEELSKLDPSDQLELLAALMLEIVASVLKADPENIPIDKAIDQLGVDSLMATEIQMLFDTQLGLNVSILELIGEGTVRSLAALSLKKLKQEHQAEWQTQAV